MNKLIYIVSIIVLFSQDIANAQNECDCNETVHTIDTTSVISNIREQYQVLTSLQAKDFDYIYTKQFDVGCHEPELVIETTYYLDNKIVITSTTIYGSGHGDVQTNTISTSYFADDVEFFNFTTTQSDSYRPDQEQENSYKEEIRTYYDKCGFLVKRLQKKATAVETDKNRNYDLILAKKNNLDITYHKQKQKQISTSRQFSSQCECDPDYPNPDTTSAISKIRDRYQYLESLQENDFDYIYRNEEFDGCNEPDELTSSIYYLDGKMVMEQYSAIGSGEWGIRQSCFSQHYYQNDVKIFTLQIGEVNNDYNLNALPEDTYKDETRSYFNECGYLIRKLYKKVTQADLKKGEDLDKALAKTHNTDITNKK